MDGETYKLRSLPLDGSKKLHNDPITGIVTLNFNILKVYGVISHHLDEFTGISHVLICHYATDKTGL